MMLGASAASRAVRSASSIISLTRPMSAPSFDFSKKIASNPESERRKRAISFDPFASTIISGTVSRNSNSIAKLAGLDPDATIAT